MWPFWYLAYGPISRPLHSQKTRLQTECGVWHIANANSTNSSTHPHLRVESERFRNIYHHCVARVSPFFSLSLCHLEEFVFF